MLEANLGRMQVVIIGAGGRLGKAFLRVMGVRHEVRAVTRRELDLRDASAVRDFAAHLDADWVINCAAVSGLEDCLDDPLSAHMVNAQAPELLAASCHRKGIAYLQVSTDYVLDGRHTGKKNEDASCKPINSYGQSKLEGELRVSAVAPSAWIGRISWIFCEDLGSFPHQMLAKSMRGEPLGAISDKLSLPTFADDFVVGWEALAKSRVPGGIYHFCNQGDPVSWWDYGNEVLRLAAAMGAPLKNREIQSSRLADAQFFRDPRPIHTAMDCSRFESLLGGPIRPWQEAMKEHLGHLAQRRWVLP